MKREPNSAKPRGGGPRLRLRPIFGRDPIRFFVYFRFFRFHFRSPSGILRISRIPAGGLTFFVYFVYFRFYSFSPFDAIWPARQGRLPGPRREGRRRHSAFDLHIEMTKIRPFGLKSGLRPAGTPCVFRFSLIFVLISFCHLTPFGRLPKIGLRPAGTPFVFCFPLIFVYFRFHSCNFVYFPFFAFRNGSNGAGIPPPLKVKILDILVNL